MGDGFLHAAGGKNGCGNGSCKLFGAHPDLFMPHVDCLKNTRFRLWTLQVT